MYQKHSLLNEPQNTRQKYMKYERLLQIINEGALYFSHISEMKDKWEGMLTTQTKDKLFHQQYLLYKDASAAKGATNQYEQHKDLFYINCWHMNERESYLMWKVYGDRECAVQTNYERLIASFESNQLTINGCSIKYIDYKKDEFNIGNIFLPVSHKDIPYSDEREYRLICWKPELEKHHLLYTEKGVNIQIDVDMLIDKILINPSKNLDTKKLQEEIEKRRLSCSIEDSRIISN